MWTKEHHQFYRRKGEEFPSALRDAEWARLAPLIPPTSPGGRTGSRFALPRHRHRKPEPAIPRPECFEVTASHRDSPAATHRTKSAAEPNRLKAPNTGLARYKDRPQLVGRAGRSQQAAGRWTPNRACPLKHRRQWRPMPHQARSRPGSSQYSRSQRLPQRHQRRPTQYCKLGPGLRRTKSALAAPWRAISLFSFLAAFQMSKTPVTRCRVRVLLVSTIFRLIAFLRSALFACSGNGR